MQRTRRSLLIGLGSALAVPAVMRAESLLPLSGLDPESPFFTSDGQLSLNGRVTSIEEGAWTLVGLDKNGRVRENTGLLPSRATVQARAMLARHPWLRRLGEAIRESSLETHLYTQRAEPIASLRGDEFAADDESLIEKVSRWYAEHGVSTVDVPEIGPVALDGRAVRGSLSEWRSLDRLTISAFTAVPDVLQRGREHDLEEFRRRTAYSEYLRSFAMVTIGGCRCIVLVGMRFDATTGQRHASDVVCYEKPIRT